MARLAQALVLLVLLKTGRCAARCPEFQCPDGACVRFSDRCDGVKDCADKSDEDTSVCRSNQLTLLVHQNVTARVSFQRAQEYIEFVSCDAISCSHLDLYGTTDYGQLSYVRGTRCNAHARGCLLDFSTLGEGDRLPSGEYELVVQRLPGWLVVTLQDHPEKIAVVEVSERSDRLQIQPGKWLSEINVQYSNILVAKQPCPEFTCKNDACARYLDKCDGVNDCWDDSDEDPAFCLSNTIHLAEWQKVRVRAHFRSEHKWVEFVLCDASSCSSVDAHGRSPDGGLSYVAAQNCNAGGRGCTVHASVISSASQPFQSGEVQFIVERRFQVLAVMFSGEPHRAATVPINANCSRLQIRPGIWAADIRVEFSDSH